MPRVLPPFVDAAWLAAHRDEVVLADVRFSLTGADPRAAYEAGHLPGALYVDLGTWLADHTAPATEGRHPLPDPATFAEGMARSGIGDAATVVAYDDEGGVIAARLVWMLRAIGRAAALLDGAIGELARHATADPTPPPARATFTPRPWPAELLADAHDAAARGNIVLDARQAARYAGQPDGVDPRAGHIPGARNVPVREHVDADGRLLEPALLRARFAEVGIDAPDLPVVSSCGSGVTACHNLLVLEHLGLGPGRLYPGSWSQWSRSDRPAATGSDPG